MYTLEELEQHTCIRKIIGYRAEEKSITAIGVAEIQKETIHNDWNFQKKICLNQSRSRDRDF